MVKRIAALILLIVCMGGDSHRTGPSIVLDCLMCLETPSAVFTRHLFPYSRYEYKCVMDVDDLTIDMLVTHRACTVVECLCITEKPQRVFSRKTLCQEKEPYVCQYDLSKRNESINNHATLLHSFILLPVMQQVALFVSNGR